MNETYLEDLFDQLVTVKPRPAWNDVLARARRSRRRYSGLVALVALFVLVPSAWAVARAFDAPPPPTVQSEAAAWNKFAPQAVAYAEANGWPNPGQYGTTADLSKLHGLLQVQTPYGPLDAWGAPSSNGGLCYFLAYEADLAPESRPTEGSGGGCSQPGGPAKNSAIEIDSDRPAVYLTYGHTDAANAASAQVTLKVGEDVRVKTGPVVDGFYLAAFARDPAATDRWDTNNVFVEKVVTSDASGKEIETWQNPCPTPPGTPCSG